MKRPGAAAAAGFDQGPDLRLACASPFRLFNFEFSWRKGMSPPDFVEGDIHVWHANLRHHRMSPQEYISPLSKDELERAARFHFDPDRRVFTLARAILRTLLGRYLDVEARDVRFSYSQHGKPSLAPPLAESQLQFNLSHTAEYVLIGMCLRRQIGVDVEQMRSDFEIEELASRFFSTSEQRAILRLPKSQRRRAFFRCWTRKESLLKARGGGLLLPLEDFDVSVGSDNSIRLATRPNPEEAGHWCILNVAVRQGYAAAVTVSS